MIISIAVSNAMESIVHDLPVIKDITSVIRVYEPPIIWIMRSLIDISCAIMFMRHRLDTNSQRMRACWTANMNDRAARILDHAGNGNEMVNTTVYSTRIDISLRCA